MTTTISEHAIETKGVRDMIDARELRIGSWVNLTFNDPFEIPTGWHIDVYHRTYSGIELTEEWLVKLGFEDMGYHDNIKRYYGKKVKSWLGGEYYFQVIFYKDYKQIALPVATGLGSGNVTYREHRIEFVHQIQNAFRSNTGKELTIK